MKPRHLLSPCVAALCALQAMAPAPAHAQAANGGDVKRGADVFSEQCAECHSVREGKNKKGPSLYAVVGRSAAQLPGVEYSDALKASGWVWNTERLQFYLSQPAKKANPGGKMKYEGVKDAKDLADLLAYMATVK